MKRADELPAAPARVPVIVASAVIALAIGLLVGRGTASPGPDEGLRGAPSSAASGLPVGYPRDQAGAASAAANLSAALALSIAEGPGHVLEVARRVGTDGYAARVAAVYEGNRVLDPAATVLFRAVPITYRVLDYSPELADVRVWSASILAGEDRDPGAATFKTATISVRWQEGDWRLDDVRDVLRGPTPATSQPTPGVGFIRTLEGMEAFIALP